MELLAFVAEEAGIEYDMGTDLDEYDEAEDSPASIALALQRVEKEDTTMETDVEETTMPVEDELEMSGTALGLMSRRA
jgi:hypothetical protein